MIIIPDLFTPYLSGVEMARKANWEDLQNYNQVQKGQLDNLLGFATFSPKVNKEYETTDQLALGNLFKELTFNNALARDQVAANKALLENLLAQHAYQQYMGGTQAPTTPQVPGTMQVNQTNPTTPTGNPSVPQGGVQSPTQAGVGGVPNIEVKPPAPQKSASTQLGDWLFGWWKTPEQQAVPNWTTVRP